MTVTKFKPEQLTVQLCVYPKATPGLHQAWLQLPVMVSALAGLTSKPNSSMLSVLPQTERVSPSGDRERVLVLIILIFSFTSHCSGLSSVPFLHAHNDVPQPLESQDTCQP